MATFFTEKDYKDKLEEIWDSVDSIEQLETQMNELFPERQFLLHQMILAILTQQNHLTFGTYGTGKSELISMLVESLGLEKKKDELFQIEITKDTSESDVFGGVNIPAYRDTGEQHRNPNGTIRCAKYADISEIFDNPRLLRSLLGVLNERHYRNGNDCEDVPLRSAFASTNIPPQDLLKIFPNADAIIDRFLFQCKVNWIKESNNRLKMLKRFQHGCRPLIVIDQDKLDHAIKLITDPTDQIDEFLLTPILEIFEKTKEIWGAKWRQFSDRALCQWLIAIEANAILNKRYKVLPEDLYVLKYVICDGEDDQLKAFDSYIKPIIEEAMKTAAPMDIDDAALQLVESIKIEFEAIPKKPADTDLVSIIRKLGALDTRLKAIKPKLDINKQIVSELRGKVEAATTKINLLIQKGGTP